MAEIESVETFGTTYGPGIRYVIFLQNNGISVEAEDLINEIKKYRDYLITSHGGVTISGSNPLSQTKFIQYFFRRLAEYNIHRAISTSGNVKITEDIKKVLKLTDLVLLNITQFNTTTIEFARYLSMNDIPVWIKSNVTDKVSIDFDKFIQTLNNIEKVL